MDFIITVNDAHIQRIRTAFGRAKVDPANPTQPPEWTMATAEEVRAELKRLVRERVVNYETTLANDVQRARIQQELNNL